MAVGWSAAIRREGATGHISGTVDFTRAMPSLEATGKYWAREVSRVLLDNMARGMPADTGYSRGHLHMQVFDKGRGYHVGVLGLTGKQGESLEYLALMDRAEGIARHFYGFYDSNGGIRTAFLNWALRKGVVAWGVRNIGRTWARPGRHRLGGRQSAVVDAQTLIYVKTGKPARGLMTWGYSRPWAHNAFQTASRVAHELLQSLQNSLGKNVPGVTYSAYTRGSIGEDFEE